MIYKGSSDNNNWAGSTEQLQTKIGIVLESVLWGIQMEVAWQAMCVEVDYINCMDWREKGYYPADSVSFKYAEDLEEAITRFADILEEAEAAVKDNVKTGLADYMALEHTLSYE